MEHASGGGQRSRETYRELRPRGAFTILSDAADNRLPVAVKVLEVLPSQRLSLQRHRLRSEEWTSLEPGLRAQIGEEEFPLRPGVTYLVPALTEHRIWNESGSTARLIELHYGEYLENDIERLDDDYSRA